MCRGNTITYNIVYPSSCRATPPPLKCIILFRNIDVCVCVHGKIQNFEIKETRIKDVLLIKIHNFFLFKFYQVLCVWETL